MISSISSCSQIASINRGIRSESGYKYHQELKIILYYAMGGSQLKGEEMEIDFAIRKSTGLYFFFLAPSATVPPD